MDLWPLCDRAVTVCDRGDFTKSGVPHRKHEQPSYQDRLLLWKIRRTVVLPLLLILLCNWAMIASALKLDNLREIHFFHTSNAFLPIALPDISHLSALLLSRTTIGVVGTFFLHLLWTNPFFRALVFKHNVRHNYWTLPPSPRYNVVAGGEKPENPCHNIVFWGGEGGCSYYFWRTLCLKTVPRKKGLVCKKKVENH